MPFVSNAQRRACWAKYNKDVKAGRKPAWDCELWEEHTVRQTANMPVDQQASAIVSYLRNLPAPIVRDMAAAYGIKNIDLEKVYPEYARTILIKGRHT